MKAGMRARCGDPDGQRWEGRWPVPSCLATLGNLLHFEDNEARVYPVSLRFLLAQPLETGSPLSISDQTGVFQVALVSDGLKWERPTCPSGGGWTHHSVFVDGI